MPHPTRRLNIFETLEVHATQQSKPPRHPFDTSPHSETTSPASMNPSDFSDSSESDTHDDSNTPARQLATPTPVAQNPTREAPRVAADTPKKKNNQAAPTNYRFLVAKFCAAKCRERQNEADKTLVTDATPEHGGPR